MLGRALKVPGSHQGWGLLGAPEVPWGLHGTGLQQVWAVGMLAPQKLGWVPWVGWGVQNLLCWVLGG